MANSLYTLGPVIVTATAGTTAVQVATASAAIRVVEFVIQNTGTANCYIGSSAVVTTAGFLIAPGDSIRFNAQKPGKDQSAPQTYDPSNYWVVTGATGNAIVLYYDAILNRTVTT